MRTEIRPYMGRWLAILNGQTIAVCRTREEAWLELHDEDYDDEQADHDGSDFDDADGGDDQ